MCFSVLGKVVSPGTIIGSTDELERELRDEELELEDALD